MNAITIADEILKLGKKKDIQFTPLQLMKLVYISHGFSLAFNNTPLFGNRIEAWKYGPVIPDLYQATKSFGRDRIPFNLISEGDSNVDASIVELLTQVVDKYGHLSGSQLSNLTHKAGTPWAKTFRDGTYGLEISNELIASHYRELLNGRDKDTSA